MSTLALWLPLLPFAGALAGFSLCWFRAPRGWAVWLAVAPTAAAALGTLIVIGAEFGTRSGVGTTAVDYAPTGVFDIWLGARVDGLAALTAVLVGVVALAVQVYSVGYMRDDPRYRSYAAFVSLFTAAMLLVVYSADLVVLLVGWEVMGACSYFLIGHHWERREARAAAVKAFLVTKAGDVPFLFGIFVLGNSARTFQVAGVLDTACAGHLHHATLAAVLLLGGVVGKSAQFPLHSWLPDAMAGPTPISALIHAATMVAAGVYLVARLYPVFLAAPGSLVLLSVVAAVTMVGAALAACAQRDLKRVLAYSTVSQLAYMTGALAAGSRDAAMFHLLSHGAFKALLFLAAGVVIHRVGSNDIATMGGLRRHLPVTFWTMTIGLAALAGVPPIGGFFSKESVLGAAYDTATGSPPATGVPAAAGWLVLLAGLLTALLTAAYATRAWLLVFFGGRGEPHDVSSSAAVTPAEVEPPAHPAPAGREAPWTELAPLVLLAIGAVLIGVIGLDRAWLPSWLGGADGVRIAPAAAPSLAPSMVTTVLSLACLGVGVTAVTLAWRADPEADPARLLGRLRTPSENGFGFDRLQDVVVVVPVRAAARLVMFLDHEVVDAYVRGSGTGARLAGGALRRVQNGNAQWYLTGALAGALVVAVAFAL